jgi:hypothetical protein
MRDFRSTMIMFLVVFFAVTYNTQFALGGLTPEEVAQLGKNLTEFGAEKAGNAEGTIPPYTGGLTQVPPGYVPNSGFRPDPFASEKPLFSIDAKNMAQYADKLTVGTKHLMEKFPTFRIDVYPSHRTCRYPDYVLKNSVLNATRASTANEGLACREAKLGVPFPIPKTGYEVMWNNNLRYNGLGRQSKFYTDLVDNTGRMYSVSQINFWEFWPYYDQNPPSNSKYKDVYWLDRWIFLAPPRKAGEGGRADDPLNIGETNRSAWLYLPGQRRVKLAPQVAFDTPSSDGNGNFTYDETWLFNGSMERYDMKLIGKKEMYVPYNAYKAVYVTKPVKDKYYMPHHVNPDVLRWELHRVWIVEGTLKPGKRHCYKTRRFYIDEDSWSCSSMDVYDAADKLFHIDYTFFVYNYETDPTKGFPCNLTFNVYNLNNGCYLAVYPFSEELGGFCKADETHPEVWWSAEGLAMQNIR